MTQQDMIIVTAVVAVFGIFAAVLAFASWDEFRSRRSNDLDTAE